MKFALLLGFPMFLLFLFWVNVIHGFADTDPVGFRPNTVINVTIVAPEETCKGVTNPMEYEWCISTNEFQNRGKMMKKMGTIFHLPRVSSPLNLCMDIRCLCRELTGKDSEECQYKGQALKKRVRKEYRMMTDDERIRYHNTVNVLKKKGAYDELAKEHTEAANLGAHMGPAFLPWHREYLKRFEFLLLKEDPTVSLPYWDSTLDAYLPIPSDSIMFTDELSGYHNKFTNQVTGPYAGWTYGYCAQFRNRSFECLRFNPITPLTRVFRGSWLITDNHIENVMRRTEIHDVLAHYGECGPYTARGMTVESFHGYPHSFVSGTMADTPQSSFDPIFFSHHAFVDLIWELWRTGVQGRQRAASEYPKDVGCTMSDHHTNSPMTPFFPLRNIDGISNDYMDFLFEYSPRPSCSRENRDCGSRYLFCSLKLNGIEAKCVSKVKPNGNCYGYTEDDDVCFDGVCKLIQNIGSRCIPNIATSTEFPTSTLTTTTTTTSVTTTAPTTTSITFTPNVSNDINCYNEVACCEIWRENKHCTNPEHIDRMKVDCQRSCGFCTRPEIDPNDFVDYSPRCPSVSNVCDTFWGVENCRKTCNISYFNQNFLRSICVKAPE